MIVNVFRSVSNVLREALCALVFVFIVSFAVKKFRRDPRLVKFAKTLPGPRGLPVLGNGYEFFFGKLDGFAKIFSQYSNTYGSVYRLWLGKNLIVALSDVEHLEAVFQSTKTLGKPEVLFRGFKQFARNSLFTAEVPLWKKTRKRLQPLFSKNVFKFQMSSFNRVMDEFIGVLDSHVDGAEFDMGVYLSHFAVSALLDSYFNIHLSLEESQYFGFDNVLRFNSLQGALRIFVPWLRIKFIGDLYFRSQLKSISNKFQEFFSKIQTAGFDADKDADEDETKGTLAQRYYATIRQLQEEVGMENYASDEMMSTIIASSDTMSTTLALCLLMVSIHKEIQHKLHEELQEVFGDDDDQPVDLNDLDKLTYFNQVIKETARKFTLVPTLFRNVDEDIKIGSMVVPAGAIIMVRVGDVHMDPKLYPNPDKFDPEHFNPEATNKRSKFAFLPFSAGTRDCIGKSFAEVIVKLTLVKLLRNFKFNSTIQEQDFSFVEGYVVTKFGGYWMSVTSRKK